MRKDRTSVYTSPLQQISPKTSVEAGASGVEEDGGWGEEWREVERQKQPVTVTKKATPKSRGMALSKKTPTQASKQSQAEHSPPMEGQRGGGGDVEPEGSPVPPEQQPTETPSSVVRGEAKGERESGRNTPLATSTPTSKTSAKTQVSICGGKAMDPRNITRFPPSLSLLPLPSLSPPLLPSSLPPSPLPSPPLSPLPSSPLPSSPLSPAGFSTPRRSSEVHQEASATPSADEGAMQWYVPRRESTQALPCMTVTMGI